MVELKSALRTSKGTFEKLWAPKRESKVEMKQKHLPLLTKKTTTEQKFRGLVQHVADSNQVELGNLHLQDQHLESLGP